MSTRVVEFTPEQIATARRMARAGATVEDVAKQLKYAGVAKYLQARLRRDYGITFASPIRRAHDGHNTYLGGRE